MRNAGLILRRLWQEEHGLTIIEYLLLASLIVLVVIGTITAMGLNLVQFFRNTATPIAS